MKAFWKGASVAVVLGLLAGCGGGSDDDDLIVLPEDPQVRVLHAIRGAPNVDVAVDGRLVLEDVAFQQASANLTLDPGERNVQVFETGTDNELFNETYDLGTGERFSIIAADPHLTELLAVQESRSLVLGGKARVNVVHAAANAGVVDVYVSAFGAALPDTPTINDAPFNANVLLPDQDAGEYQIRITGSDSTDVVFDSGPVELGGGDNITVVAVDSLTERSPVDLVVLTGTATNPVIVDDTAYVRVVHGVPGALVDVYINEAATPALPNFAFGDTSGGYVAVNSSPIIDVVLAGGDIADAVIEGQPALERGAYYTVIANGTVSAADSLPLGLYALQDDLTPAPAMEARVRVIHAAPFAEGDNADVDVYATTGQVADSTTTTNGVDPLLSLATALGYQEDTGYLPVTVLGDITALVTAAGGTDVAIAADLNLVSTGTYSVIALGDANAEGLTLVALQDQENP